MDRREGVGLTVALVGHVALLGLLSASFLAAPKPLKPESVPIEVALVDEVGLESTAPDPSTEAPAAKLSPVEAPIEPESAPPEPVQQPEPVAKPQPAPAKPAPAPVPAPDPKPVKMPVKPAPPAPAKPAAKPAPASPPAAKPATKRPTAPTGRLDGILAGLTDKPSTSKSTTPPAAKAGPEVKASLIAELSRKLRPFWRAPTGADADKLRTVIKVRLDKSGAIVGEVGECQQTGITESNRVQADLHCENAKKAVRLAAPFTTFPPEYYDTWKVIYPAFDWRLSR